MSILKRFIDWSKQTGNKNKTPDFDYNVNYDKTRDYLKDFYKKENKWKRDLRERLNSKVATYGHLPGSVITKNNWTSAASTISSIVPDTNGIIKINSDIVSVKTALEVNGRDILKELDEMRDALLLLKRDVDMEAKYPRLKELKDEYERALEKYKTFEALK
jgi:hypothetical protein